MVRAQHSSCYTSRAHLHKDRICATRGAFTPIKPCSTHPRYPSPHTQGRILGVNPAKLSGQSCFLSVTQDWSQTLSRLTLQHDKLEQGQHFPMAFNSKQGAKENSNALLSPGYPSLTSGVTDLLCTLQKLTGLHGTHSFCSTNQSRSFGPVKDRHTAKGISRGGINVVNLMTNRLQISISPSGDEFSTSH